MPTREKQSPRNAATAAVLRGLRSEHDKSFAELEELTGIKEAQLERLLRNQATFNIEDFSTIVLALGEDPQEILGRVLAKVESK